MRAEDFKAKASQRRKTVDVEVEGVGSVRLRALSAGDAIQFQADVKKATANGGSADALAFVLIARSWVGEDGEPWFPEEEGVAVAASLAPESFGVIAKAVLVLNGLDEGAVESAMGNSEAGEPTPTDSPASSATPTSI